LRLRGELAQFGEVGAENLHRDVGSRAREHVVDAVRDRLADDDLHAGEPGEVGAQRGEELILAARIVPFAIFRLTSISD
jgi:hypothetical protein